MIFILLLVINVNSQSDENGIVYKTFIYKTVGTTNIKADLIKKTDNATKPVIIWIHGGGLIFGSRADIPEEQRNLYLDAGYSIVSIDYRLAPETKLPDIASDVVDAINWVRSNAADSLKIDSKRIFLVGHSGGAYLALLAGYFLKNPPNAMVSFYGYGQIDSEWLSKPDPFYLTQTLISEDEVNKLISDSPVTAASFKDRFSVYVFCRQRGFWPLLVSGHNPANEKDWFERYAPLRNIGANYPPVLLIHGDKDKDVPFEESVLLDKELKLKNIKHKFIRVNNYGHVFDLADGGLSNPVVSEVFNAVLDFLMNEK
jgi:acetyl esterase/lipase